MSHSKHNITKKEANGLYETMKYIHDIFTKNNIIYWLTGGTLLGAFRHGGIIPWDDDGDICIMKKDVTKLKKLIKKMDKDGYYLEKVDEDDKKECTKKRNSCDWYIEKKSGSLGIDIFVMERDSKKKDIIQYSNDYWRYTDNGGIHCYFYFNHTFPLVPIRFGNFFTYIPNNPVEHLNRCYGNDWNSLSRMLFNHRLGKWMSGKPKKLKPTDYFTIKAPKKTCDTVVPQPVNYYKRNKSCII